MKNTNKIFRLYHVQLNKIEIAYDDYESKTEYKALEPFEIPKTMSEKDAFTVISYINKKVNLEHKNII